MATNEKKTDNLTFSQIDTLVEQIQGEAEEKVLRLSMIQEERTSGVVFTLKEIEEIIKAQHRNKYISYHTFTRAAEDKLRRAE